MANRKKLNQNSTTNNNVPLELMNELYRAYDHFNNHFCNGTLPRPILSIAQSNKKCFGWFAGNNWNHQGKEVSEINIHAAAFQKPDEVFDTLLHEMSHLKNFYDNECKLLVEMPNRIDTLATAIFGKKFKTIEDLKAIITENMFPAKKVEETVE